MSGMPLYEMASKAGCRRTRCCKQGLVGPAAQRIHAGEDVGDVLAHLLEGQSLAVVAHEVVAVAAGEDQHAAARRAAVRLDDEVAAVADSPGQAAQLGVAADDGVDLGRRHADAAAQVVHAQLVIDDGEQGARVVVEDAGRIAPVHPQDAEFLQLPRGAE